MKIFIDQSGKVEQTNTATVVAFANGKKGSVLLSAKDKRVIKKYYRLINKPTMFSLQVFSSLVFLIIQHWKLNKGNLIIDKEYSGRESVIKKNILILCDKKRIDISSLNINFSLVGKTNACHVIANKNRRLNKSDRRVSFNEVAAMLKILLAE